MKFLLLIWLSVIALSAALSLFGRKTSKWLLPLRVFMVLGGGVLMLRIGGGRLSGFVAIGAVVSYVLLVLVWRVRKKRPHKYLTHALIPAFIIGGLSGVAMDLVARFSETMVIEHVAPVGALVIAGGMIWYARKTRPEATPAKRTK